jgi:hypothetical protein
MSSVGGTTLLRQQRLCRIQRNGSILPPSPQQESSVWSVCVVSYTLHVLWTPLLHALTEGYQL